MSKKPPISMTLDPKSLTAFKAKFAMLSATTKREVGKQVAVTGTKVWAQAMINVPVQTGNLQDSLRHDHNENKPESIVHTRVEYAYPVEVRKPYLFPAAESERTQHNTRIAKALKKGVK